MMTKNFLRKLMSAEAAPETGPAPLGENATCEEKLAACEQQIDQLREQKELHARALKEMYQYLCKLDASFRSENKRLQAQLEEERERSNQLIDITNELWEIIEKLDESGASTADFFPLPGVGEPVDAVAYYDDEPAAERISELPELRAV